KQPWGFSRAVVPAKRPRAGSGEREPGPVNTAGPVVFMGSGSRAEPAPDLDPGRSAGTTVVEWYAANACGCSDRPRPFSLAELGQDRLAVPLHGIQRVQHGSQQFLRPQGILTTSYASIDEIPLFLDVALGILDVPICLDQVSLGGRHRSAGSEFSRHLPRLLG